MRHKNSKIKTGNNSCPALLVLAFDPYQRIKFFN